MDVILVATVSFLISLNPLLFEYLAYDGSFEHFVLFSVFVCVFVNGIVFANVTLFLMMYNMWSLA